ncbi:LytTR family DNA-binding domain-containing protein [Mangrovimonas sp. TPBH4]|uniref:LytR/AlgR family response regulator transcription factor n=1 Tax=Mangrovimonas sp. TPBH4 TaxID=1645914 RepID=UPI0006B5B4DB|nr:LytTR family DNA-binding domain-containing protein [Mangrovimonas sp. TPBH4]
MKINCIIIENNTKYLNILKRLCYENEDLNWIGSFADPLEAIDTINTLKTVLIFCNIGLLEAEPIKFTQHLKGHPMFVFRTKANASLTRIKGLKTIESIQGSITAQTIKSITKRALKILDFSALMETNIFPTDGTSITSPKAIMVKYGHEAYQVSIDDITYIQGMQGALRIHLTNTPPVRTLMKITALEEKLDAAKFVRIHPSFLVNITRITAIQKKKVKLNDIYLPVSDSFKPTLLDRIGQFE